MKSLTFSNWPEPMKRWPSVMASEGIPSISNGTTLPSNRHRMRLIGRTQRRVPEPQRIDLGQGKVRMTWSTVSATRSVVARPLDDRTANRTPSRSVS